VAPAGSASTCARPSDLPPVDWQEMAELVEDSYRRVALLRMLRALDGGP
jgi:hypothetical protein